ncbi:MAG: EAL domain-containing protein [Nitrosomonadales bacterium]|nr:EAL domain-containing protein [Nitrosomonadales bacterium]
MSNANKFFLGRQSILDRAQSLAGFELLFRSSQRNSAQFLNDDIATGLVINHAFNEIGFKEVLGKQRGFINVSKNTLMSDMIELLPRDQLVLELLETIDIDAEVVERCKHLKSKGYMLALDDVIHHSEAVQPLRGIVDVIKIDIMNMGQTELTEIVTQFKKWPVKLLAEKVDDRETATRCFNLGFNLFQGYYFSKPVIITGKRLAHSELELIRLIGLVMSEADTAEIEKVFKESPGLTFNLLRLTNSAAFAKYRKIASVSHAIMELGRRQLLRWLQMLLFANDKNALFPNPLLQLAATRGKFMELLAQQIDRGNQELEDHAYMVGIMSLMDTLLSMPLAEVISPLSPPFDVSDALLFRSGQLGQLLQLIELLETNDMHGADDLLESLTPLDIDQVNSAQVKALAWANSIGQETTYGSDSAGITGGGGSIR